MTAYSFTKIGALAPFVPGHTFVVSAYFALTGALASADTITADNIIPPDGVQILNTQLIYPRLDTSVAPTGTFNLGDADSATRFISGGLMSAPATTTQISTFTNVAPSFTDGTQVAGNGYVYAKNENNTDSGYTDLVVTVGSAVATGATSGLVQLIVTYQCVGNA